jgi:hypothetical protein
MQLAAQVDELRAGGSRVETILPDSDSLTAFGVNPPRSHGTQRSCGIVAGVSAGPAAVELSTSLT